MDEENDILKGKITEMKLLLMKNSRNANISVTAVELVDAAEQYRIGAETLIKNLRDQVAFLENHNQLMMNNIVTKLDENIKSTNVKTYKDALSSKPTNQNLITILVKPKQNSNINPSQVKELICNTINPTKFKCVNVQTNKTNVAFKFRDVTNKNKFLNEIQLETKIYNHIEAYEPQPKCPTIIIKNIDYSILESDLIQTLIVQNDNLDLKAENIKILYTIKRKFFYNAVLCVSPHLYNKIHDQTLTHGWTASIVEETFLIGACNRCLSFRHRTKECPLKDKKNCKNCGKCFSTIQTDNSLSEFQIHIKSCKTTICFNCTENNSTTDKNHPCQSTECPIYNSKLKQIKESTSYDENKIVKFNPKTQSININPPQVDTSSRLNSTNN
ncbi:uncharacterized protein LOC142645703 [Dermatophagoides pteronyssinus]|uniref:uncharacterized protein LOC142645703 n=1 Tax=Dermatophagoides pteronyssinus TaxID=6956 RepID=UPI003F660F7F